MVIPIVFIADWLMRGATLVFDGGYGALVTIVSMPLFGVVALWSSIKARGPGPFGDPNWFDKAALRFKVQYPDGKRKWKLWE